MKILVLSWPDLLNTDQESTRGWTKILAIELKSFFDNTENGKYVDEYIDKW